MIIEATSLTYYWDEYTKPTLYCRFKAENTLDTVLLFHGVFCDSLHEASMPPHRNPSDCETRIFDIIQSKGVSQMSWTDYFSLTHHNLPLSTLDGLYGFDQMPSYASLTEVWRHNHYMYDYSFRAMSKNRRCTEEETMAYMVMERLDKKNPTYEAYTDIIAEIADAIRLDKINYIIESCG